MNLRDSLNYYTQGALAELNHFCQSGMEGYITTSVEGNDAVFVFTAHKSGRTRFCRIVKVEGAAQLAEEVQVSEQIRLLKKQRASFQLEPTRRTEKLTN